MSNSQFTCIERDLNLNILDYSIESQPTVFKGSVAASGQDLELPVLITIQRIRTPGIISGNILETLGGAELCPGAREQAVLPLLEDNSWYDQLLVGIVGEDVVYRSRECHLVVLKGGKHPCPACQDLLQGLGVNSSPTVAENTDHSETDASGSRTEEIKTEDDSERKFVETVYGEQTVNETDMSLKVDFNKSVKGSKLYPCSFCTNLLTSEEKNCQPLEKMS